MGSTVSIPSSIGGASMEINQPVQEQVDDELKCPLCLEGFNAPRIISCYHTFCQGCLASHINNTGVQGKESQFKCPTCQAVIRPPVPSKPKDTWPTLFPLNTAIPTAHSVRVGQQCHPCHSKGRSGEAVEFCADCKEYLCIKCARNHQSFQALKNHKTVVIDNISIYPEIHVSFMDGLTCSEHLGESFSSFCIDHDVICCASCRLQHKHCANIVEIRKYAQRKLIENGQDESMVVLHETIKHMRKIILLNDKNMNKLQQKIAEFPNQIKSLREKMNQSFDRLEERVKSDGEKILNDARKQMTEVNKQCQSMIAASECSCKLLDVTRSYGDEMQKLFTLYNVKKHAANCKEQLSMKYKFTTAMDVNLKWHKLFKDIDSLPDELAELDRREVPQDVPMSKCLKPTPGEAKKMKQLVQKMNTKEVVVSPRLKQSAPKIVNIETPSSSRTMELSVEFEATGPEYGETPSYTGATYLPDGRIFLVDFNNKRCSLFDSFYHFEADYVLPGSPWDACYVNDNIVAVSVPDWLESQIVFLSVSNSIEHIQTINTLSGCRGIESLKGERLVISGYNMNSYKYYWAILNKDGRETYYQELEVEGFSYTNYLAVNNAKTRVYIAFAGNSAVYCFGFIGKLLFKYKSKELKNPEGIGVDSDDNVYVLDGDSGHLHILSSAGQVLKIITSGIPRKQRKLCFTHSKDVFFVSDNSGTKHPSPFGWFMLYTDQPTR
ncbi:hypothetical protein CHS0354_003883 [Potamilus streckersoni]|uniref:Uncharacterized protein n=1 Tax=Potamilus streckersoni TaxID=2493646 RepID=A0AAE0TJT3_9BIVA|nr:hypothetical protein CHS0354_003883 [Potamilus streckersoni]